MQATCKAKDIKLKVDVVGMGLLCQTFSLLGICLWIKYPKLDAYYEVSMKKMLEAVDAKVIIVECAAEFLTNADEFTLRLIL